MPVVPFYRGSNASPAQVFGGGPAKSPMQALLEGGKDSALSKGIAAAFYNPKSDPDVQRARLYGAQADKEAYDLERAQAGAAAVPEMQKQGGIAMAFQRSPLPGAKVDPEGTANALIGAYQGALANNADPKIAASMLQSFMLQLPPDIADQVGVRVNSMINGNYIKSNESPSLARQDFVRDDEQAADQAKQDSVNAETRYGNDLDYKASIYGTDVRASTDRRGQDVSARVQTRGQDVTDRRERDSWDKPPTVETTVTTLDKGDPGKPASRGFFGIGARPETPARLPAKTVTTTKGSAAGALQAAAPGATPPAQPQGRAASGGQSAAPVPGARQGNDGNWYVPDPQRPGKYLKVG